ncbi:MAG: biotin synthase BioB [Holosporaceae bacterium]|jgi:biotin synthase|nr:biotin synthase BioB [Holosporaceae bacterium]
MKTTFEEAYAIFNRPFFKLLKIAHDIHAQNFDEQTVQISDIISVKTGGCSEDCAYCAQSARNGAKAPKQPMLDLETVVNAAKKAKEIGASRFCMSASGRCISSEEEFDKICETIKAVKALGLETCVTLGFLTETQVKKLKEAGLDYYNHNIDSSREFYKNVATTRTIDDRLKTIELVQNAGINACAGGIVGMGETNEDRVKMLVLLANLCPPPRCVPINKLVKIPGTKVDDSNPIDDFDFVRLIATARVLMPKSYVKIAAGRNTLSEPTQALCIFAGANALFSGEKLLTVDNMKEGSDKRFFDKLGIKIERPNLD